MQEWERTIGQAGRCACGKVFLRMISGAGSLSCPKHYVGGIRLKCIDTWMRKEWSNKDFLICHKCNNLAKNIRDGCPEAGKGWRCDACWKDSPYAIPTLTLDYFMGINNAKV